MYIDRAESSVPDLKKLQQPKVQLYLSYTAVYIKDLNSIFSTHSLYFLLFLERVLFKSFFVQMFLKVFFFFVGFNSVIAERKNSVTYNENKPPAS